MHRRVYTCYFEYFVITAGAYAVKVTTFNTFSNDKVATVTRFLFDDTSIHLKYTESLPF